MVDLGVVLVGLVAMFAAGFVVGYGAASVVWLRRCRHALRKWLESEDE